MPASHLRCSQCGTERPLEGVSACDRCFAPLEPVYDLEAVRAELTRERIAAGPPSLWRYAPLLPVAPPEPALLAPGFTPLVAAPRLAAEVGVGELYLKLDTANPTHSFKDRVVAVASAKAQELGLEALACASTGNLANAVAARAAVEGLPAAIFCPADVEREKLLASAAHGATIYAVRGNYDACSRLTIELSFELPWAFVNVDAARVLRRGLEDARLRGRRAARAGSCRTSSPSRSRRARCSTRTERGFGDFLELGLVDGPAPRLIGSQPEGCSPVADAFAEERLVSPVRPDTVARSLAIGNPADGDAAVDAVRRSGGAIHAVPEDEIGENMLLLASTAGVFGETAAGVTLGALRAAVAAGEVGPRDRVVLFVTGDGLKTLAPVGRRAPAGRDRAGRGRSARCAPASPRDDARVSLRIVTLPGDGIGPEVTAAAVRVLDALPLEVEVEEHLFGGAAIHAHGDPLPPETLAACRGADAVLLGAVGLPEFDGAPVRPEQGLIRLRGELDVYANLRPTRADGVDLLIVRELVGGLYFGASGRREDGSAYDTLRVLAGADRADRAARVRARARARPAA